MVRTGIHLLALRNLDEPLLRVLDLVDGTSYEGVEFAEDVHPLVGTDQGTIDEVATALERTGLESISARTSLEPMEEKLDAMCDIYADLGCEKLVASSMDESNYESVESVMAGAARLEDAAARARDNGMTFYYHNHPGEFAERDGFVPFETIVEETEAVKFEIDIAWAGNDNADIPALLHRLSDRIDMLHCKDVVRETGTDVDLGEGDLDLPAIAAAAKETDIEWLVFERDNPEDPIASMHHGAEKLAELLG